MVEEKLQAIYQFRKRCEKPQYDNGYTFKRGDKEILGV